jgi:hypothetical protein
VIVRQQKQKQKQKQKQNKHDHVNLSLVAPSQIRGNVTTLSPDQ